METQNSVSGRVSHARWCPSPNYDARPAGVEPSLLVVHNISLPAGKFGGSEIEALFCNQLNCDADPSFDELRGLRVSAHFLIDRDGCVTQFVSCADRAWHAGVSRWGSRGNCNDFSIGVELEGTDHAAFATAQYASLVDLIRLLRTRYPGLRAGAIAGHSDIAPGRKTDPGPAFDWTRLGNMLRSAAPSAEPSY